MTELLLVTMKFAVATVIFAIGLGTRLRDVTWLLHRPRLLLRSLLAMYLLVPLAAWAIGQLFPISDGVRLALVIFAVSAGAPLLPKKLGAFDADEYVFSLVVITTFIGIAVVPLALAALGPAFDNPIRLAAADMARTFAKALFLPLVVGLVARPFLGRYAEPASERLMMVAGIVLSLSGLTLLLLHLAVLGEIRLPGAIALAVFLATSFLIGHLLGGPTPDERTVLAVACATRHLGIAVIVATAVPGPRAAVLITTYVLVGALVSIAYLRWRAAARGRAGAA
jgi:BASS family bile acid:Na+ symporter